MWPTFFCWRGDERLWLNSNSLLKLFEKPKICPSVSNQINYQLECLNKNATFLISRRCSIENTVMKHSAQKWLKVEINIWIYKPAESWISFWPADATSSWSASWSRSEHLWRGSPRGSTQHWAPPDWTPDAWPPPGEVWRETRPEIATWIWNKFDANVINC